MANKNQETPKPPEANKNKTMMYKFGDMISGILANVLQAFPKTEKKSESKGEMPKKGK
jgi:hypothetical protein